MQKRPINDHDYDSLSLEFAYARNMWKKYAACMWHMQHICLHILPNLHIFLHIVPHKVLHILRKFAAINQHTYKVVSDTV